MAKPVQGETAHDRLLYVCRCVMAYSYRTITSMSESA
ncbi:hypothetical protein RHRU231_960096 [Rhodococcus ruber]|uniref:Transposase n=1 Tax=Rhodococcus ruber TaxID=1830 RepID=A0A098BWH8_9NOCA|nr:hypothetical protein RHRU231_960096 [Rhodococcus ruber]